MSWLHPVILYGLGLAAIPVILHLLLKQKPKKLLFPALRLIQDRRKQNVRRMRMRHLLLLLLRVAIIAVFVLAIARPSVPAADYSLNLRETLTLVGVIAAAVAVYYGLSYRWRSAALPTYELKSRQSRLRGGTLGTALLLLLLAVVWPYQRRVAAQLRSPRPAGDVTLPVAAAILLDTSLSMGYQQAGKTRLDVAREIALARLSDLPGGSRVAVADVGSDHPILFQSTLAGAKMQLESRELRPRRIPLNDRIRAALRLHEDDRKRTLSEQGTLPEGDRRDRYLRRIYVLTDLAASAWRVGGTSRLAAELEQHDRVNLFVIDAGELHPTNTGIIGVEPSRPRVTVGGEAFVQATVAGVGGSEAERTVELLLDEGSGRVIKVDQQTIPPGDGSPQVVEFGPLVIDAEPIVHGEVRLVSSDPLPFDDARFFTVQSRPPIRVLTIARPNSNDANEWSTALEVEGYESKLSTPDDLADLPLAEFDVICLINIPSLTDDVWDRLGQYVERGGGLAIFLGSPEIDYAVNYDRETPRTFLPGVPLKHTSPGIQFLRVSNSQHPMMKALAEDDLVGLLESLDVMRFWRVEPAGDAAVIAEYSDDTTAPALLERRHGDGRVMMFTTAVDMKDDWWAHWNFLPDPSGPVWTFLAFADELVRHLAQDAQTRLTYDAGEQPILTLDAADHDRQFLLQHPGFRQSRLTLPADELRLTIDDVSELGRYNLKQPDPSPRIVSGFSINPPPGESDFTRLSTDELDDILGAGRYQLARSLGELQEDENLADLGRELFPLILAAAVFIFCAEHFMANWFYDDEPGTTPSRVTWETAAPEATAQPVAVTP